MQFNIPVSLTLLRIILAPLFATTFYLSFCYANYVTVFIFIIAALTDWLDGFLARRWNHYYIRSVFRSDSG